MEPHWQKKTQPLLVNGATIMLPNTLRHIIIKLKSVSNEASNFELQMQDGNFGWYAKPAE